MEVLNKLDLMIGVKEKHTLFIKDGHGLDGSKTGIYFVSVGMMIFIYFVKKLVKDLASIIHYKEYPRKNILNLETFIGLKKKLQLNRVLIKKNIIDFMRLLKELSDLIIIEIIRLKNFTGLELPNMKKY